MMVEPAIERAIEAFRAINAQDPNLEQGRPRELLHAERLAAWVGRLEPNASLPLRLAAHCQHVGRFRLPRSSYPEGRSGYLRWRAELARRHAETAEAILQELAFDSETIAQVKRIVSKQNATRDADVQTMEDALCLAFLEHELREFAERHDDDKLVRILRKTWKTMSERARELALTLPLDARAQALIATALNGAER
jgi:hypothetical protein